MDTSFYTRNTENELLEILAPTSTKWVTFYVTQYFDLKVNAVSLGIAHVKSYGQLPDLPDGVYQIRLSVKPNFASHAEFFHLRTINLETEWNKELCKLYSAQCSLSKKDFEESKRTLLSIWMDIKAASAKIEICHERTEGLNLYEKAKEDLNKYRNDCGC